MQSRILVVTSCTGRKRDEGCARPLELDDFKNPRRLAERETELARWRLPAGEMYAGRQHTHTVAGVGALRRRFGDGSVDLVIVSAGYGLLGEGTPIVPYNLTFSAMSSRQAVAWADHLGVAGAVRKACGQIPLVIFLLGARYLEAIRPPVEAGVGQRLVFLARPAETDRLSGDGAVVVPAGAREASRYGDGLVALKGKMFRLFASGVARAGDGLLAEVMEDSTPGSFIRAMQLGLGAQA